MSDKLLFFNSWLLLLNGPFDVEILLTTENKIGPWLGLTTSRGMTLSNGFREHFHPTILFDPAVCVEVNDLSVAETDSEAFFNKHVTLFFFGEGRFTSSATLGGRFFLGER